MDYLYFNFNNDIIQLSTENTLSTFASFIKNDNTKNIFIR